MPSTVDADTRRREIVDAAINVLAERGVQGFTLRVVASALGGSVTLVTHYYSSREELLSEMARYLGQAWEVEALEKERGIADPMERLRILVHFLLPTSAKRYAEERAYIKLLAASDGFPEVRRLLTVFDRNVRQLFRRHLTELVPADSVDEKIDMLRAVLTGTTVSAVEYGWSQQRQRRVLDEALRLVLSPPAPS